jgi:hypothetical protein
MSTNSYTKIRNKILLETLMSPKFYKNKQNFILKEDAYSGAEGYVDLPGDVPPPPSLPSDNIKVGEDVLLDIVNISLDILGIFDPTGIADLSNMLIYIGREQYMDAFFSLLGAAIPYVGDTFKAAKVISKGVLIKGLDLVIGNAKAKKTIYEILMWLSKKSPACKKFADWVASFIYKNTNEIADYVLGKEAKQISKEIINKKMVEATSAWSIQGQKAMFKKNPISKSIEAILAGGILALDIKNLFEKEVNKLNGQLNVVEQQLTDKFNKEKVSLVEVVGEDLSTYEIPASLYITACQMYYILSIVEDPKLIAVVLARKGLTLQQIDYYLDSAEKIGLIKNKTLKQQILNVYNEMNKEDNEGFLKYLAQYISKIIPDFITKLEQKKDKERATLLYKANEDILNSKEESIKDFTASYTGKYK